MVKQVLVMLSVVAVAAAVWAQPVRPVNYNALIGGSDAIILAGVDKAVIPPLPTAGGGGGGMMGATGNAAITVKVVKVYTGTITEASLDLTVPLTANRPGGAGGGGGGAAPTAWTPDVSAGKNVVIGLVKAQGGWKVTPITGFGGGGGGGMMGGSSSVYAEADATAIATAIAAFPVKATVAAPTAPLTIGDKVSLTITVKNTGATAITLNSVSVASTQESKLTTPATFTLVSSDIRDAATGMPRTIAAGAEGAIKADFTVVGPANWQMFDAKSFPMASSLSATVGVTQAAAAGGGGGGGGGRGTALTVKTAWVDAQLAAPKP